MNIFLILAYVTGGIMVLYSFFLYIFPSNKLNLILKSIANILSVINLVFVYLATKNTLLFAGMTTTFICFGRELGFAYKDKYKVLNHICWPILISSLLCLSLIFTYAGPLSLLPTVGSVISTFGFFSSKKKLFKLTAITSSTLYVIYYAILIESSAILTLFSLFTSFSGLISSIIGLIVVIKEEKKEKAILA